MPWVDKKNGQRCTKKGCSCRRNPCRRKLCGRVFASNILNSIIKSKRNTVECGFILLYIDNFLPWFITLPLTYLGKILITGKIASIIIWLSKNVISVHYFLPSIFKKWFFPFFTLPRLQICVFFDMYFTSKKISCNLLFHDSVRWKNDEKMSKLWVSNTFAPIISWAFYAVEWPMQKTYEKEDFYLQNTGQRIFFDWHIRLLKT